MPEAIQKPSKAEATPKRGAPFLWWVYVILGTLVAGVTGYAIAQARSRTALSAASQRQKDLESAHAKKEKHWQAADKELKTRVRLLEARRTLNGALMALEERNFGIAQERLEAAGKALMKDARDNAALQKAAERTQAFRINVSEDVGGQRDRLVALSRAVDEALDAGLGKGP